MAVRSLLSSLRISSVGLRWSGEVVGGPPDARARSTARIGVPTVANPGVAPTVGAFSSPGRLQVMKALLSPIVRFLMIALRPPASASPPEIRRAGGLTALFGLSALVLSAVLGALFGDRQNVMLLVRLTTPLWVTGFGAIVIGGYRLVFAAEPEDTTPEKRMAFGVLFGCGALVLLLVLGILGAFLVAWVVDR